MHDSLLNAGYMTEQNWYLVVRSVRGERALELNMLRVHTGRWSDPWSKYMID